MPVKYAQHNIIGISPEISNAIKWRVNLDYINELIIPVIFYSILIFHSLIESGKLWFTNMQTK